MSLLIILPASAIFSFILENLFLIFVINPSSFLFRKLFPDYGVEELGDPHLWDFRIMLYWLTVCIISILFLIFFRVVKKNYLYSKSLLIIFLVSLILFFWSSLGPIRHIQTYLRDQSECNRSYVYPKEFQNYTIGKNSLKYEFNSQSVDGFVSKDFALQGCIVREKINVNILFSNKKILSNEYLTHFMFSEQSLEQIIKETYEEIARNYYYSEVNDWIFTYPLTDGLELNKLNRGSSKNYSISNALFGAISMDNGETWNPIKVRVDSPAGSIPYYLDTGMLEIQNVVKDEEKLSLYAYSSFYNESVVIEFTMKNGEYIYGSSREMVGRQNFEP